MLSQPPTYLKAIVAAVIAGLGALAAALGGEPSVTAAEWVTVALATAIAFGTVYGIPNARPSGGTRLVDRADVEQGTTGGNVRQVPGKTWATGGYPGGKAPTDPPAGV